MTTGLTRLYGFDIAEAGEIEVLADGEQTLRVIDVWAVKTGGDAAHGDRVTVMNGRGHPITDALQLGADEHIVRARRIHAKARTIPAGGKLRVTARRVRNVACSLYVLALGVP